MRCVTRNFLRVYRQELELLRQSEKPRSVHKLASLRDNARSEKIQLEASKTLAAEPSNTSISIGVAVQNITPGYIVDTSRHSAAARRLLAADGSGVVVNALEHADDDGGLDEDSHED